MQRLDWAQRWIDRVDGRARQGIILLVMVGSVLLTACTDPQVQAQLEQLASLNQAALQTQSVEAGNRLLIQGVDGNLYTVRPDGTARQAITNNASSLRQYVQPTWSPSGERIAWAEVNLHEGEPSSFLTVARYDGLQPVRYETPFAPFYIQWSPDEEWVAYLSNWISSSQPSLALRLVDLQTDPLAEEDPIRTLVEGQPLYFAWAPDGDRLLTHVSNERVEFRTIDGEGEPLVLTGARFPAPQWSADGTQLLYADGNGGAQRLVLDDVMSDASRAITDFDESISFALNATGERIAYVVTPTSVGTAAFGPLYIYELDGQRTRAIGNAPVVAFFWSPDGSKLAYLMLDESEETLQLRWYVWDGARSRAYAPMVPSRTFLTDYLAFFDQYARSMTIWAPDSSAFAYAAVDPDTGSQIWVQTLDAEDPITVGRGVFASWSPR